MVVGVGAWVVVNPPLSMLLGSYCSLETPLKKGSPRLSSTLAPCLLDSWSARLNRQAAEHMDILVPPVGHPAGGMATNSAGAPDGLVGPYSTDGMLLTSEAVSNFTGPNQIAGLVEANPKSGGTRNVAAVQRARAASLTASRQESPEPQMLLTSEAVPNFTAPNQIAGLVEPLLNQLNQWSRKLAPLLEQGGAQVDNVVAPVGAKLKEWSMTLQPLVARGGDEVSKALAPVYEALVQVCALVLQTHHAHGPTGCWLLLTRLRGAQLLARLEPYTTPAIDVVRGGATSVVDVIKGLLHQLAPLWKEACRGTIEWHTTQLQPWLATTGDTIKASSAAVLEDAKLRGAAVAKVLATLARYTRHACHTHHTNCTHHTRLTHDAHLTYPDHTAVERDSAAAVGGADWPADPGAHGQRRRAHAGVECGPAAAVVRRDQRCPRCGGQGVVARGAALLLLAVRERRGDGGAQGARGQAARPRAAREGPCGVRRLPGRSQPATHPTVGRLLSGAAQIPICCYTASSYMAMACTVARPQEVRGHRCTSVQMCVGVGRWWVVFLVVHRAWLFFNNNKIC